MIFEVFEIGQNSNPMNVLGKGEQSQGLSACTFPSLFQKIVTFSFSLRKHNRFVDLKRSNYFRRCSGAY